MAYSDFSVTQGATITAGIQNANMINQRFMVSGTNATAAPAADENLKDLRSELDTNTTDIATNTSAIAGLGSATTNFIINPIDENMVDQYGKSGTNIGNEYFIDRWQQTKTGSNVFYTKPNGVVSLATDAGAPESAKYFALQLLEDVNYSVLEDKQVTFSAKVTSNHADARLLVYVNTTTYYSSSAHTGGGSEEELSVTVSAVNMASLTNLFVYIGIGTATNGNVTITTSDYIQFRHAQLTIGDTVQTYNPRQYGQELALCQRYYYLHVEGANTIMCVGGYYSATEWVSYVKFPVTMRTSPSLIIASGTNYYRTFAGSGGIYLMILQ